MAQFSKNLGRTAHAAAAAGAGGGGGAAAAAADAAVAADSSGSVVAALRIIMQQSRVLWPLKSGNAPVGGRGSSRMRSV